VRVLHLYSGNLFGGIETILVSLARHARGSDVSHEFAVCFDARLAQELRDAKAPVHLLAPVRVSRPQTIGRARKRLASLLASRPFDVCVTHAPWSHALFAATVRRADASLAFWAHDAWRGRHWTERWARRTVPDLLIANSAFTADTVAPIFGSASREIVHAPIDVSRVVLAAGERAAIRRALTTPDDAVVVVQASRLESWKGHATLLRALAALKGGPSWMCWIAGGAQRATEQRYAESLRALVDQLGIGGRVRFAGERTDVPRLLAAADVYCQPNSSPEPFGIVLIEALAAGLPVVTTASGGALEIVDDTCGRLVPDSADAGEWASILRSFVGEPRLRARLGAAGPSRAAAVCDPGRQLQRLHQALRSVRVAVAR